MKARGMTLITGITLILCLALNFVPTAAAQTQPAQPQATSGSVPVIKAQTRLVLVDVVVTDKKGNYIHDLTQKEFRVWEDDREQTIKTFSFANSGSDLRDQREYQVLLFDNANVTQADQKRVREAAAQFVEASAGPHRYTAILDFGTTLNVAQSFTTDAARLKQVVLNDKFSSVSTERDSVQVASIGSAHQMSTAQHNFSARYMLLAISNLAKRMAAMPGRKSLILLSPGFVMGSVDLPELKAAADACNRANVAVYPIMLRDLTAGIGAESYVAGSYTYSPTPKGAVPIPRETMPTTGGNQQVLNSLAEDTGGFVILKSNNLPTEMEKIAADQGEYYVLGYTPAASQEGTCHNLRVKVERGGTNVRSRTAYCNFKAPDPLSGKPIEKQLEAQASGETAGTVTASMLAPYFYSSPNVARVALAIELPPGVMNFAKEKGKFTARLDILALAYKPDGTVAARFSDSVPVELNSNKEVEEFNKTPLRYNHEFEAAPGSYNLKVAFATGKESFGRLEMPLTIDPYDGNRIAMSGVALSKEIHPVRQEEDVLAASLLEDRTPLVSHGFEFVPSGSPHFKKGKPGAFYVEVYDPLLLKTNPPQVSIQVKILDTKTGEAKLDAGGPVPELKPGNPVVPLGLKIPVETLPPGNYRLELGAADSAGNSTTLRSMGFVVE